MERAPYFDDITNSPATADAYWLSTNDGVRIRLGVWPQVPKTAQGTILMFPGRTEYIEKYAPLADRVGKDGYAMIAVDWRGQGIADRLMDDPLIGHVGHFVDYQRDVAAVMQALDDLDLPKPYYLIGHSMGGAIGLRALNEGLPVQAAGFSAPMWGIGLPRLTRISGWSLSRLSKLLGFSKKRAPGSDPAPYILDVDFAENTLTSDREMFDFVRSQITAHPELGLAGPSLSWLYEALTECAAFLTWDKPPKPILTLLGTDEDIVDPAPIKILSEKWDNASLKMLDAARHETLIETPALREDAITALLSHFQTYS